MNDSISVRILALVGQILSNSKYSLGEFEKYLKGFVEPKSEALTDGFTQEEIRLMNDTSDTVNRVRAIKSFHKRAEVSLESAKDTVNDYMIRNKLWKKFHAGQKAVPVRDIEFIDGSWHLAGRPVMVTETTEPYFNINHRDYQSR